MTSPDVLAAELAGAFARTSGILLTEETVDSALDTVTSLAVATVAGSSGAGLTLLASSGKRITSAATDPLVRQVDDLQYSLDEGPCLTAWRDLTLVQSGPDDDRRWPSWSPRSRELGVRSFLSTPLRHADSAIGALKVYSPEPEAFDRHDADLLQRLAAQAAIFVGNVLAVRAAEQFSDGLLETLQSRDLIARARGILMERHRISDDEAFVELSSEAGRGQRSLREAAMHVIDSAGG